MIFVSGGHHMAAKGAAIDDFNEFDEAKVWVSLIVHYLGHLGLAVPPGTLREKTTFINSWAIHTDIAIEIHFNDAMDSEGAHIGSGCETLYYPGSVYGKKAAEKLQDALSRHFAPDRGIKEGWYRGDPEKGAHWFLQRTRCPALILEPEFIQHFESIQAKRDATCRTIADTLISLGLY